MKYVTEGLQPADALRYFEEISAIPRSSRCEKAVADYVCSVAEKAGLEYYRDDVDNIIVRKPASKGCENVPPLMLQANMDMVCVKVPGCEHNFDTDGLDLYIEDGCLRARGTTLGADDGTGCAHMLALMTRDDYVHPPMEFVFTTMEEIGLVGVIALDASKIKSRRMINMDSGASKDCDTVVTCAGGIVYEFRRKPVFEPAEGEAVSLKIGGLKGGHSAITIGEGRGNAIKLMGRIIKAVEKVSPVAVCSFAGGEKMNAICSECAAVITVEKGKTAEAIAAAEKLAACIASELTGVDDGFKFEAAACDAPERELSAADSKALLDFVTLLPNGMREMSRDIPGLVQYSSNLGAARVTEDEIYLLDCIRSAEDSLGAMVSTEFETLAALTGFKAECINSFGGWKFMPDSGIRTVLEKCYEAKFGRKMVHTATHGGMETGVLKQKVPDMDLCVLAPTCDGAHTPDEYMNLESFRMVYELLLDICAELCK